MELAQFYGTRAPPLYSIDIGSVLYTNMLHPSNYIMHFTFDFGTSLHIDLTPYLFVVYIVLSSSFHCTLTNKSPIITSLDVESLFFKKLVIRLGWYTIQSYCHDGPS